MQTPRHRNRDRNSLSRERDREQRADQHGIARRDGREGHAERQQCERISDELAKPAT
jgi:hypothetical protein